MKLPEKQMLELKASICVVLAIEIDKQQVVIIGGMYKLNNKIEYIKIPKICPICGADTQVINDNDTEVLMCTNSNCKGKLLGKLAHFVSKNAINIDGLSEQTLQKFIDLGWLNSFQDIYHLSEHKEEMYKLDGFGKKSVDKLLESIEKSRNTTLNRFIYSLCVPMIGRSASKDIAKASANGDIQSFITIMSLEGEYAFIGLNGFGKEMCKSLVHWWVNNKEMFYALVEEFNFVKVKNDGSDLNNKTFVITGSLNHYQNRSDLVNIIESMGGKVSGSVSAKTSFLINNNAQSSSSKNLKAKKLNIPIISEEDFVKMIS